jgi:uncharacterized protein YrrD
MHLGQEMVGKPVFSVEDGRKLGSVKDLYFDEKVQSLTGLYLGQERLLSLKANAIQRADVKVFGVDAILTLDASAMRDKGKLSGSRKWVRRDRFPGRKVATAGGTKVGVINDVLLDDKQRVIGFTLRRVFVEGPVAENNSIARESIVNLSDDDVMIVDLASAEKQTLKAD